MIERRSQLTGAMVELVAQGGLEALTVREVARATGVSIGTVQHHFPTKREMLLATLDEVTSSFAESLGVVRRADTPAEALEELCLALLPLSDASRSASAVWLAFLARAAVEPELADLHARWWGEMEAALADLLRRHRGGAASSVDDRADAALVLATLDGLAVTGLVEPVRLPPDRMRGLLRRQLEALLEDADPA